MDQVRKIGTANVTNIFQFTHMDEYQKVTSVLYTLWDGQTIDVNLTKLAIWY